MRDYRYSGAKDCTEDAEWQVLKYAILHSTLLHRSNPHLTLISHKHLHLQFCMVRKQEKGAKLQG